MRCSSSSTSHTVNDDTLDTQAKLRNAYTSFQHLLGQSGAHPTADWPPKAAAASETNTQTTTKNKLLPARGIFVGRTLMVGEQAAA